MSNLATNFSKKSNYIVTVNRNGKEYQHIINFTLPSFSIPSIEQKFHHQSFKMAGDTISPGDLNITYIVDESLTILFELYNWLHEQRNVTESKDSIMVTLTDSYNNPLIDFMFFEVKLENLGELELEVNSEEHLIISGTFSFASYSIYNRITKEKISSDKIAIANRTHI